MKLPGHSTWENPLMGERAMDWRVDVRIDGLTRSFVYPSESVARKVITQIAKCMSSGEGVIFASDHVLNPRHIVSAQVIDYGAGDGPRAGEAC
jgi:hypothetical protein